MRYYLYCDRPTNGGAALIRALQGKRLKVQGSRYVYNPRTDKVINWGCTDLGRRNHPVLNSPANIAVATNKLLFFRTLNAVEGPAAEYLVPFTASREAAQRWIDGGAMVVARRVLNGHSGAGIVICGGKNPLVEAPLYTKYIPKDEEYRIHYMNGGAIYTQKKVKRADFAGKANRYVRNHDNGYTYQHNNIQSPAEVFIAAQQVFNASGLDFGAVDVIYVRATNRAYVLEINTAPGLEGHSVEVYAAAFSRHYGPPAQPRRVPPRNKQRIKKVR